MKSFFVIKGNPHKWFDQQGKPIELYHGLPHIKEGMYVQDAVGADVNIDNPNEVPNIKVYFHVHICSNENEVKALALSQNIIDV